jgi:hypothetical protein
MSNKDQFYVERRPEGDYVVRRGGAYCASAVDRARGDYAPNRGLVPNLNSARLAEFACGRGTVVARTRRNSPVLVGSRRDSKLAKAVI